MELNLKISCQGALLEGKAPEIVQNNLDAAITKVTLLLEREVIMRTPQGASGGQGGLINSINHDVFMRGTPLVRGVVVTASKYGEVIERGRLAGKGIAKDARPALIRWVNVKLGIQGKQAERVAFLIARKIKARGFEGRHMFENALNENMGKIDDTFKRVGFEIARELSE